MMIDHPEADSVRSVAPASEIPFKMWVSAPGTPNEKTTGDSMKTGAMGLIVPIVKDIPECYNMPRQELPTAYYQNACIDIMRRSTVMEKNSMTGDVILGYLMNENYDIDTEEELERVQRTFNA